MSRRNREARVPFVVYGERPPPCPEGLEGTYFEPLGEPPRPGDDTELHRVPEGVDQEVLAFISGAGHAVRLIVEGQSLAEAHGRAAEALEAMAALGAAAPLGANSGALAAVDVFCLEARWIGEASDRLRRDDAASTMLLALRPGAEPADVDVETYGLRKLGLRELVVPAVPPELVEPVGIFLNDVARYARRTPKAIAPGDAIAFGWVDLRALAAEALPAFPDEPQQCAPRFMREALADHPDLLPGMLVLCEPEHDGDEAALRLGARRAAEITAALVAGARQCGLSDGIDVPRALETAVASRSLAHGGPAELRRLARDEIGDSGWVAVGVGAELDDADAFELVPLRTLASWLPRIFGWLALPAGAGLSLGADDTLTIHLPDGNLVGARRGSDA